MAWPPVPAMATRAEQFDELVLDAAARIEQRLGRPPVSYTHLTLPTIYSV